MFQEKIQSEAIDHDLACGVPYGAISLATAVSIQENKPLIFKRKEVKAHGVGNLIEGVYQAGNRCLVIDDVVTSGISIVETVNVKSNSERSSQSSSLLTKADLLRI